MSKKQWFIGGEIIIGILIFAFIAHFTIPRSTGFMKSTSIDAPTMHGAYESFGMAESVTEPLMAQKQIANSPVQDTIAINDTNETERLIIKTGSLSMVVKNVADAINKITNYANKKNGFVVTSSMSKYDVAPTGSITIRIPVDVFDAGFEELKNFGEVEEQSVNGQDVTEEYVDQKAQLSNLKATEAQFLEFMKRAVTIEDILNVQRELTRVQGQIDSLEGRMKYLGKSAAMSTLTIHLSTDVSTLPVLEDKTEWKPVGVIKDATRSLIDIGKTIINVLIWILIFIPLWLILGVLVWGMKKYNDTRK